MSDYGCYNVTEPPIDAPRDPMYKSEREVSKVWMFSISTDKNICSVICCLCSLFC